jgi:hypothetical protein
LHRILVRDVSHLNEAAAPVGADFIGNALRGI